MKKVKIILIAVGIIVLGLILRQVILGMKKEPQSEIYPTVVKYVNVDTATYGEHNVKIVAYGRLKAGSKIDIISEVGGTVERTSPPFKIGNYFKQGSILIKIDDEDSRLNLYSQKSDLLNVLTKLLPDIKSDFPESFNDWNNYLARFDITKDLEPYPAPKSPKEKYFLASRNLHKTYYLIKNLEYRLTKYTIRAPFDGVVTNSTIDAGTTVRVGQVLGEFASTSGYELELQVPFDDLRFIKINDNVNVYSENNNSCWVGKIIRIANNLDPGTQTVKVYVALNGSDLKEGLYLKAEIDAGTIKDCYKIPRSALANNKYVYIIANDSILNKIPVDVIKVTDEYAYLRNIAPGTVVITQQLVDPQLGTIYKPLINNKK